MLGMMITVHARLTLLACSAKKINIHDYCAYQTNITGISSVYSIFDISN
jgi:hypothetical protein